MADKLINAALILSLCLIALADDNCANVKCPKVPKHYEELGCRPITRQGQCCASSYDCDQFKARDLAKCYHKGKAYAPNESIDDPELASSCTVGCRCNRYDDNEPASVICAHIDCPEFFGISESVGNKCISQYGQNECCKQRDVCDDELKNLSTCNFNGKTYYQGERMDVGDSCYSCICGENFEDKPPQLNAHCKKIDCNIDLHYGDRIQNGCVPIYYKTEDCCPIGTRCPDDKTSIIKTKNSDQQPDAPKCTFGSLKLSIGDNLSLESSDKCKVCSCKIPPFVTCIQTC